MTDTQAEPRPDAVAHTFRARYAETDAMGVVHHSTYVVWMEAGRTEYMRAHGFTYRELEAMGVMLPVVELGVRYRQPAYYDDEIAVACWAEEVSRSRIRLAYSISRRPDGAVMAEGFTLHTYMGRDGKILRMSQHPEVLNKLTAMQLTPPEPSP